jgi:hypothetical protein
MSFGPSAPDPYATANTQLGFSKEAAQAQQQANMINQVTPFGSLAYQPDPNSPGGYTANINLSPAQQAILDAQQRVRAGTGSAAAQLTSSFGGLYGQPPNIDPSTLTNKVMGWGQQYMQPIFNMQQSNLDANLRNQGIAPGDEAWNNAQNLQSRNVNNAYTNLLMQAEPTAFNQAIQEYKLPMQTAAELSAPPTLPNTSTVQTPQAQVQTPNYQQAVQNQYLGNTAQNAAMNQGIWGLGGNLLSMFL